MLLQYVLNSILLKPNSFWNPLDFHPIYLATFSDANTCPQNAIIPKKPTQITTSHKSILFKKSAKVFTLEIKDASIIPTIIPSKA